MQKGRTKNLIPFNELTEEEQRAIAKKGGKKSAEIRRKQSTFKSLFNSALSSKIPDKELKEQLKEVGIEDTYKGALMLAMIEKALAGDVNAFKLVSEMIDEKASDEPLSVSINVNTDLENQIKQMEEIYLKMKDK